MRRSARWDASKLKSGDLVLYDVGGRRGREGYIRGEFVKWHGNRAEVVDVKRPMGGELSRRIVDIHVLREDQPLMMDRTASSSFVEPSHVKKTLKSLRGALKRGEKNIAKMIFDQLRDEVSQMENRSWPPTTPRELAEAKKYRATARKLMSEAFPNYYRFASLRLTPKDKKVIDAFTSMEKMDSSKLTSTGTQLDGNWMGGTGIAFWRDGKIFFRDLGSRSAQTVQNAIKKSAPKNLLGGNSQQRLAAQKVNPYELFAFREQIAKLSLPSLPASAPASVKKAVKDYEAMKDSILAMIDKVIEPHKKEMSKKASSKLMDALGIDEKGLTRLKKSLIERDMSKGSLQSHYTSVLAEVGVKWNALSPAAKSRFDDFRRNLRKGKKASSPALKALHQAVESSGTRATLTRDSVRVPYPMSNLTMFSVSGDIKAGSPVTFDYRPLKSYSYMITEQPWGLLVKEA